MNTQEHIENTLTKIRTLLTDASVAIEAMTPGSKMTAVNLGKELSARSDLKPAQITMLLSMLVSGYPGINSRKGPGGGIEKLASTPVESK